MKPSLFAFCLPLLCCAPAMALKPVVPGAPAPWGKPMPVAVLADPGACRPPRYPRIGGPPEEPSTVMLALLIGADGRVRKGRITHSSGYRALDRAAMDTLRRCRYQPLLDHGAPRSGWARIAYTWTLE